MKLIRDGSKIYNVEMLVSVKQKEVGKLSFAFNDNTGFTTFIGMGAGDAFRELTPFLVDDSCKIFDLDSYRAKAVELPKGV
ncbi:MAG: hypothetical protein IKS49_04480 [Actinomycetaceae bacterium]|nr:hypothetical protein [Actinomycetaceae bacterium]